MKAGHLKQRVTVQKMAVTRDSTGEELETWTTVATRWAQIEPLKSKENYQRNIETTTQLYTVTMRYQAGLVTTDRRLVFGSQYLDIESVVNVDQADVTYELLCRATT